LITAVISKEWRKRTRSLLSYSERRTGSSE
jgi:hypothetical protein